MHAVTLAILLASASAAAAPKCHPPMVEKSRTVGDHLEVCFYGSTCWKIGATGAWSPTPQYERSYYVPNTTSSQLEITICAPDKSDCHTVATPPAIARTIGFATDGTTLAARLYDGGVKFFDVASNKPLAAVPTRNKFERLARVLVVGRLAVIQWDQEAIIIDVTTGATISTIAHFASSLAVVLDGRIAMPLDDGSLALYDLATGKPTGATIPLFESSPIIELYLDGKSAIALSRAGNVAITDGKTTRQIAAILPSCPR